LLEINYTPSFQTDTPLDRIIKSGVIEEAIRIMNPILRQKREYLFAEKKRIENLAVLGH